MAFLCLRCVWCKVMVVRAIFCIIFEKVYSITFTLNVCLDKCSSLPIFFHLISTALEPGHRYHWFWDDAGQCWLSSAGVRENPCTWKQRLQFQRVERVPFCWFDRFPSKDVLHKIVPNQNSQQKIIQSKLHHSISFLHVQNNISKQFCLWYILKLIYSICYIW